MEERERYRRRRLTPTELLAVDDHLATCESCRRQLADREQRAAAVTALQTALQQTAELETGHLSPQLLSRYVNGALDAVQREITASHLEACAACAAMVEDLREFPALTAVVTEEPAPESGAAPRARPRAL